MMKPSEDCILNHHLYCLIIFIVFHRLYVSLEKVTPSVREHLKADNCSANELCVEIKDYGLFLGDLSLGLQSDRTGILIPEETSYAVYSMIPEVLKICLIALKSVFQLNYIWLMSVY